jgi:PAS domain S-box-containing protein
VEDFVAPEDRDVRPSRDSGVQNIDKVIIRGDGRRVPLEVSVVPVNIQGRRAVVTFFRDVSERRRAHEALERSESRVRRLIELAPDAIWIIDRSRLLFVNPATVKMFGYDSVEQVLALDPREIVHPDDHIAMRERVEQMIATGQSLSPREYRTRRRDGTWGLTEVHSMPIEWEGAPALLGFARDVTARKEMEARLARNDRLTALGTLVAGVAHEMNNPLTFAMLGLEHARAMLDTLDAPAPELGRLRAVIADVDHGIQRVAGVVRQLRANSRADVKEPEPVSLEAVVASALRIAGNELRHRAFVLMEVATVPPVMGDPQRLEQVVLNLLVNAAQALPDGRPENEIRVVVRAECDAIVIEVVDNGPGVPAEALPRVFEPFFTTKTADVGLGLGLSICHDIVTAHRGTITVESEPHRRTVFRVRLPRAPQPLAAAPAPTAASSPPVAARRYRRRVLVIDDERQLCTMIQQMLVEECDVDVVQSAEAALVQLADASPSYDVVLCDLMMPEMTGMDLHELVSRERSELAGRFVFMTGGAFTPRAGEFLKRVSARIVDKPFNRRALRAAVGLG